MMRLCIHIVSAAISVLLLSPAFLNAAVLSELHLTPDGKLKANNLTVIQKSGTNLFTRATWGNAFIRITVLTSSSTAISKKFGEGALIADIKEGHVIDVEGTLSSGAESVIVNASKIRNLALERESKTFSGTILNVDQKSASFVLSYASTSALRATTVVPSATTTIVKGARTIQFGELAVGDRVLSAAGTYDYPNNILYPTSLEIYQDRAMFTPRNFQGTLKTLSGTTLPAALVVTVEGTNYTVHLGEKALVLNKNKQPASLKRFAEGDIVRFYGSIRGTDFQETDAEVIRDLEF